MGCNCRFAGYGDGSMQSPNTLSTSMMLAGTIGAYFVWKKFGLLPAAALAYFLVIKPKMDRAANNATAANNNPAMISIDELPQVSDEDIAKLRGSLPVPIPVSDAQTRLRSMLSHNIVIQ